jgi:putative MFS transporter
MPTILCPSVRQSSPLPPAKKSIDDAPFGPLHRRLAIYSCGGPFCDGYILGIIAIALGPLSKDIGLGASWQGSIAASSLVGMFIGGALFGYLTDLLGRRIMYTLDLFLLVAASAAQFYVRDPWALFALRFILGLAIGADYPIASALLSELAPKRQRGMLLAGMIGAWWLGYTASFVAGYAFSFTQGSAWRWMLASSAVPAAIVALLRWGTPESPRWLASKGRVDEARSLIRRHFGEDYALEETGAIGTDFRRIFRAEYAGRTAFVCAFWTCQIVPAFAIYTFAPDLLRAFGSSNPTLGSAIMSLFFLAGVIPAILLIERAGRRPLLVVPFAVTAATLALLALVPKTFTVTIAGCFIIFAMFNSGSSVLQWVYPSELFPTEVRATALGFATSVSRIGAAVGAFLFPIGLVRLGAGNLMLIASAICFIGWALSWKFAPETRGLSLLEASAKSAQQR